MNSADILRVWELGFRLGPIERAITILAPALPGWTREDIASLAIGRRNALLIAARARLFGPRLNIFAECPRCRERLEFTLDSTSICSSDFDRGTQSEVSLDAGEFSIRLRKINSADLEAAGGCAGPEAATGFLVRRCIIDVTHNGVHSDFESIPSDVLLQIEARLSEADPDALIMVALHCPACSGSWELPLDIASFFWAELSAEAKRICHEVHSLASAYGWRENDLLGMTPTRRQMYLELIAQ